MLPPYTTYGPLFLFITFTLYPVRCNEPTVPWYENLPAVAMDYKVHIDPGKEDCYFQYVNPGATFYVSFQVREFKIVCVKKLVSQRVIFLRFNSFCKR